MNGKKWNATKESYINKKEKQENLITKLNRRQFRRLDSVNKCIQRRKLLPVLFLLFHPLEYANDAPRHAYIVCLCIRLRFAGKNSN